MGENAQAFVQSGGITDGTATLTGGVFPYLARVSTTVLTDGTASLTGAVFSDLARVSTTAVSYTHLTLPTIYSV